MHTQWCQFWGESPQFELYRSFSPVPRKRNFQKFHVNLSLSEDFENVNFFEFYLFLRPEMKIEI